MANKIYDNFYLSNEIEDQFNSHLDLQQFCTVDNSLVGTAGMTRKINPVSYTHLDVYKRQENDNSRKAENWRKGLRCGNYEQARLG